MVETSLCLPRKSSAIFRNLWASSEMFGNVCVSFRQVFDNLRKSSKGGWKSSENLQKHRHQDVDIHVNKKGIMH